MAQRVDAARGQEILNRWCALAEQRLEHLTELFETGRWRRYHSELSFLENIQEAKNAVETWRSLATREASLDNSAVDISWLNSPKPVPPRRNPLSGYYVPPPPRRAELRLVPAIVEAPIVPQMREEISESVVQATVPEQAVSLEVTPAPAIDDNWRQALDLTAMQERYPLLRNAL
ncbi:TIGR03809 family protein [Bradyrhizobium sp.]